MTLLVAGISGRTVWMVADTLVTGPLGRGHNEDQIKIVPSYDGKALIGLAGDQFRGAEAIEHVRCMQAEAALGSLREVARIYPVDFAYGYIDSSGPRLFRLAGETIEEVRVLHLGVE